MIIPFPECRAGIGCIHRGILPATFRFGRNADRLLIAGDAFVTTKQESVYAAATQARLGLKFSSTQEHGLPPFVECRGMLQAAARSPLATWA